MNLNKIAYFIFVRPYTFWGKSMNKKSQIPAPQNRIKIALAQKGKSNKWLAEQLGVNEPTVSLWCRNKTQPALETFYRIAYYLDIEVRRLLVPTKESDE